MATTIQSSELDFDTLKANLKTYFQAQSEFADYDFEGSGLSNILDVLAYNTHLNGLITNFGLNEAFLNTAQLRSSVVSHAESLGYTPRSYTAASASLNLSINISAASRPTSVTLPRGTQFTSNISGVTYTFRTRELYTANDDGSGSYVFKTSNDSTDIPVYEGTEKTKTFFVGETDDIQVYVIPDSTLDTESLIVRVYKSAGSSSYTEYTNLKKANRILSTSTFYQIKEVPNGYYEILFSDTTTGVKPTAGNKIVVTYNSVLGEEANGGSVFTPVSALTVTGYGDYSITVSTTFASAGGAFKETTDSIRQNVPIQFASQQRLVTALDYEAQILSNYSAYLDDVTSWGGADNVPPKYGKVFVGLKFKTGISDDTQTSVKDRIVSELTDNFSVMSITTEFTDPVTSYLELSTFFNIDPNLTTLTPRSVESLVQSTIETYFTNNLNKFDSVFRRSNLLANIDDLTNAILNSRMSVKVQQRFSPVLGTSLTYVLNYPMIIASPDDVNRIVTSGRFTYNGRSCTIRNKLSSNKLEIVNIDGSIEVDNIGNYDAANGKITIEGFNPSAIEGSSDLKVSAVPSNQSTIRPLRNYIFSFDSTASFAQAQIDYQTTSVSL
jgi:hypothetical protein